MNEEYLKRIQEADKVLIGIGEEFEEIAYLNQQDAYVERMKWLVEIDRLDLKPYLSDLSLERNQRLKDAFILLSNSLKNKDYFVITTLQTDLFEKCGFDMARVVMPCANLHMKQCSIGCSETLVALEQDDVEQIKNSLENMIIPVLGTCPVCGKEMIINSLYAEKYNEKGYLDQWNIYRGWLQNTVNKDLLILELGVGLNYPSVIRLPFEKVAFYNQKSKFIRVNEKLYQMTADLADKGVSIDNNAIDWLLE